MKSLPHCYLIFPYGKQTKQLITVKMSFGPTATSPLRLRRYFGRVGVPVPVFDVPFVSTPLTLNTKRWTLDLSPTLILSPINGSFRRSVDGFFVSSVLSSSVDETSD